MNNSKYTKWALGAAVAVLGITAVSCDDQPDKFEMTGGVPTVKYVRVTTPESGDSLITAAYMENTICLVGDNLRSIHEMYFNDQKAILNTSLMTDHTLIVDVPKNIPEDVTNKIYMHTRDGEIVTYDFSVLVPGPTVNSIDCEWALPGMEATLYGRYFIDDPNIPIKIVMPGNIEVPYENIKSVSLNELTFVVPDDATVEGQINVTSLYGTGRGPFHYHDTRGMMFDFDGVTGLDFATNCWHAHTAKSDEWSLTGNYVQMGDGTAAFSGDQADWDDTKETGFFLEYWAGNPDWSGTFPASGQGMKLTDLVDFSDFSNMSIKFEMCIPAANPWKNNTLQIAFASTDKVSLTAANNTYFHESPDVCPKGHYRPWQATGSFDTGDKWITVTMPIANFTNAWEGGSAEGNLTPSDFETFMMAVSAGGVIGSECTPIIKIDNIRAVPNL